MNFIRSLLIIIALTSFGCEEEKDLNIDQISHLYVDIMIAEEIYKNNSDSLITTSDSLYKYYNISQDQYKKRIEEFQFNEETWTDFFEKAEEYLDTLKAIESRRTSQTNQDLPSEEE